MFCHVECFPPLFTASHSTETVHNHLSTKQRGMKGLHFSDLHKIGLKFATLERTTREKRQSCLWLILWLLWHIDGLCAHARGCLLIKSQRTRMNWIVNCNGRGMHKGNLLDPSENQKKKKNENTKKEYEE